MVFTLQLTTVFAGTQGKNVSGEILARAFGMKLEEEQEATRKKIR